LFVLRSRAATATVGVDDAVVVALCRRLEGLPLAIELAASRCRLMDPHDLLSVLDDRLTQLTGEGAARPTRQRTIQATLEWSVELLSPRARLVFAQLGATAGSLALRDVLAVVDEVAPSDGAAPVHDTDSDLTMSDLTMSDLDALVDASLVRVINRRYRMLDMVRAYASHLLTTSGRAHQVRQRHLGWAIDTCKAATEGKEGPDEDRALAELSEVLPDLQLAASGAFAAGAGEDGAGLLLRARRAWFLAGRSQELWDLLDRAGHADLTPITAAEVQGLSAVIGKILGLTGLDALDRAARELRPYPSAALMLVNVLCHQAALLAESGSAQAKEVAAEAVTAARTSGSAGDVSMALDLSAYVARALGDRQLAVELARNAVAEAGAHGAQRALALAGYCASLAEAGDPATALEPGLEAVARARASGQAVTQAEVVTVVAGALGDRHATVLAQDLAVAVAVCVAYGNKQSATEAAYQLARFAAPTQPGLAVVLAAGADQFAPSPAAGPDRADLIDVLGETAYAQARAKGALLREDDIVRLAQVVADGLTPDGVVSERPFADGWRAVDEGVAN
jgi:hypothetical protein